MPSKATSTTCSGPHGDDVGRPGRLELQEPLGLPGQHLVGHALERLAEHHPAARLGVAGAEVDVGEPALAAAAAPLDGEHDEVEGVPRLDLDPARAAAAGVVGRVQRLHHDALVTGRRPPRRTAGRASSGSVVTVRGTTSAGRQARRPAGRTARGRGSRRGPRRRRAARRRSTTSAAPPRAGPPRRRGSPCARPSPGRGAARPSGVSAIASPSSTSVCAGSAATASTTSGTRSVISSRLRVNTCTSTVVLVHLDADAVELAVDRDRGAVGARLGHRLGHLGGAGGEHRPDRPSGLQAELLERGHATGQCGRGDGQRGAGEHRRAAHGGGGDVGGQGDRLQHQAVERALPQLAGHQPAQVGLLVGGGPAEELARRARCGGPGTRPRTARSSPRRRRAPRPR